MEYYDFFDELLFNKMKIINKKLCNDENIEDILKSVDISLEYKKVVINHFSSDYFIKIKYHVLEHIKYENFNFFDKSLVEKFEKQFNTTNSIRKKIYFVAEFDGIKLYKGITYASETIKKNTKNNNYKMIWNEYPEVLKLIKWINKQGNKLYKYDENLSCKFIVN